jgi:EAL domain-containing protein (putative c-di-GMP-specific phosphodiesterase class I)
VGQLSDLGIVEGVDQIFFESGLSAAELELEITESSILDDNPNIITSIGQLTDMGIGFALDDFGTGYSSLSALQRFPIERLKIDRSFVAGVDENTNDQALTSAIVALAKRLDLKVVAEGVETEAQARFLMELGCDELQGYLFSRPLPPDEFGALLELEGKQQTS